MLQTICILYTFFSLTVGWINARASNETYVYYNQVTMFVWLCIAMVILELHTLFDKWPPLIMILIQYVLAQGIVWLVVLVSGFFSPLHPDAYRDTFLSFSIPYAVVAAVYYARVFYGAKKDNALLQRLKRRRSTWQRP